MEIKLIYCFIAGALGSLAKDILQDNCIKLPERIDGNFFLGFLGGMVTGGFAGYFVDTDPTTAFLAGYAGTGVIESLLAKKKEIEVPTAGITESLIRKIAKEEGVDPDLAVRVAKCESGLNWKALNINTSGSRDRGLYQINDRYHPEVSDDMAFNPMFATQFFCKAFKAGNLSWCNSSKTCWNK